MNTFAFGVLSGFIKRNTTTNSIKILLNDVGAHKVCFISCKYDHCLIISQILGITNPPVNRNEAIFVGNIVDDDNCMTVLNITRYQRFEFFLARCVPQIQCHYSIFDVHFLCDEINTNCSCIILLKCIILESVDDRGLTR